MVPLSRLGNGTRRVAGSVNDGLRPHSFDTALASEGGPVHDGRDADDVARPAEALTAVSGSKDQESSFRFEVMSRRLANASSTPSCSGPLSRCTINVTATAKRLNAKYIW